MNPLSFAWRYFGTREVLLARAWVGSGGIAVHENLYRSRGRRAAHLLAPDEALLLAAARHLGCETYWIQRTHTVHFDLVGVHLERALVICGVNPALPPARWTAACRMAPGAETLPARGSQCERIDDAAASRVPRT